jgi:phosphatidylinositol glycan class B
MKYSFRTSTYTQILVISLLVYLVTAYFSVGYYHPDEHFQVLEFCNYKLGNIPAQVLPWEFQQQIRPAVQPAMVFFTIKALNAVSVYNPYTYTLFLRLITAILAWFVIYKLAFLLIGNFISENGKKIFLFLGFLLGFAPFLHVRFSSENYSAIALLGAIYFITRYRLEIAQRVNYKLIWAGLLLGFSFFFRFQLAFSLTGLALWLVFINKTRWQNLLIIALSGTLAILVCVVIDWWFYGNFVFTPLNYFNAAISENKLINFSIEPWWYYFVSFLHRVNPVFGVLLLVFFFIGLFNRPKDLLVWCIVPFLAAHLIIGHKEIRFLFPVIFMFSYLTAFGIEKMISLLKWQKFSRLVFIIIILLNTPALLINMVSPADIAVRCYKYLYDQEYPANTVLLSRGPNTIHKWSMRTFFYAKPGVEALEMKNDEEFNAYLETCLMDTVYVLEKKPNQDKIYGAYSSKCVFRQFPVWITRFNFNDWQGRINNYNIMELVKNKSGNE